MGKKLLVGMGLALAAIAAASVVLLSLYGPAFGIYLRKPTPQAYGEHALKLMENGYYSGTDEWLSARTTAQEALQEAESYEDTYPILSEAIIAAGGKHSRLITPDEAEGEGAEPQLPLVSVSSISGGIVTIVLPEFTGDATSAQEYAQIVISWLQQHTDAQGVIIDLRGNRGGDLAPMIAGVSPLLPDGDVLGWQLASGQTGTMTLKDGTFSGGSGISVESFKMPSNTPVAILTDEWTGSSGEAVLLAFLGMDNVRTFGAATAGYASMNMILDLYDGAQLQLTVGADVSVRTGKLYCEDPIEPDVVTEHPEEDAAAWIESL